MNSRYYLLLLALLAGCDSGPQSPQGSDVDAMPIAAAPNATPPQSPVFIEQAAELGVSFRHDPGLSGELLMPEILGAGAALADIDGDGDLDLLLVQSRVGETAGATAENAASGTTLYINESVESGQLSFSDATKRLKLQSHCQGTGVSAADIDNDGDVDFYLTCTGPNEVWRNDGSEGFSNISLASGADDNSWSGTAAFFDYDSDGMLDLYVGNYLEYAPATRRTCRTPAGVPDYCGPHTHSPAPDRLYRNVGKGLFKDVTASSGVASTAHAPALGVVAADFNQDGRIDLYVANDAWPNRLWLNQGEGRFVDEALLSGVAVNIDGQSEGSMGVDAGDYDGDGNDDLIMVHIADEKATLYAATGTGVFEDRTLTSGVGALTRGYTGFGAAWIDYDSDSWLDLLIVNGRVRMDVSKPPAANDTFPYAQRMLLLRNLGDGRFADQSTQGGSVFAEERVSRGAAFGDLDNDGDMDVVVNNANAPAFVLINQLAPKNWVGVRLLEHGRDAHGARAGLSLSDGRRLWRRVRVDGSYASANDPRVLFPIADGLAIEGIEVIWSDGVSTQFSKDQLRDGEYVALYRTASDQAAQ